MRLILQRMHPGSRWTALWIVLLCAAPPSSLADDVYLTNGEVFEGVMTEETESHVRIRFPMGGGMTLPSTQVDRIEEAESLLEQLERRRSVLAAAAAGAEEWLALARWARLNELAAYRELVFLVADLDPALDDLAPLMRGLGFVFDEELGSWISEQEVMRRAGLVHFEGEWMSPDERATRLGERREELRELEARRHEWRRRAAAEEVRSEPGPTGNEVALAQVELMREMLETMRRGFGGPVVLGYGAFFSHRPVTGGIHPTASSGGSLAFKAPPPGSSPWDAFLSHQPGSFLPIPLRSPSGGR